MKLQKKILILLFLLSSSYNFAQEFNGFKYVVIGNLDYGASGKDINNISSSLASFFRNKGYNVFVVDRFDNLNGTVPELKYNNCLGLFVSPNHKGFEITIDFLNCKNESIKQLKGKASGNFENALKRIFNQLDENPYYSFDESLTPKITYPVVENINTDENELKAYFDSTKLEPIEGIYKTYKSDSNYKLGIFKVGELYKAIIIESDYPQWKKGDVKAIFESSAAEGVFSTKYYMGNKTSIETFANLEGGLINIELKNNKGENEDVRLLKLYPKN
jgi:hypothetical protein